MTDLDGIDWPQPTIPDKPREEGGQTHRRTLRIRALLAKGEHPVTRTRLRRADDPDDSETCGSCKHLWRKAPGNWPKCALAADPRRYNDGPDIVLSWPACKRWTPPEPAD